MKKYQVRICEPTMYEVEAENQEQAEQKALGLYRQEKNTWIGEVHPDRAMPK